MNFLRNRKTYHTYPTQLKSFQARFLVSNFELQADFPFLATSHFLKKIKPNDLQDPILRQILPTDLESIFRTYESPDPLAEKKFSKSERLIQRYPDRCILKVTDRCAVHCRFCFRKAMLKNQSVISLKQLKMAADYLKQNPQVKEVLLTGGDPFTLSDQKLAQIFFRLREKRPDLRLRVGTRMPLVYPSRFTPSLINLLKEYRPLRISIHCNHPVEISKREARLSQKLITAGIEILTQTVLLKEINDNVKVLENLFLLFNKLDLKPYYLFALDPSLGTSHFRVPLKKGLELMAALQERLPTESLPVYALDLPKGGGKVAVANLRFIQQKENFSIIEAPSGQRYRWPEK